MSEAFLKVVNMSISAGWLVLAVLALRLILKKAPKWVNVLLWGIVAIRLICPFSIESALSLIPSTETISPEIMMDWTPEISTGIEPLDQIVNPVISTSFAPQGMASANPLQILIPVAANLWLLGVLILLAYTTISYLTLRYKLKTAVILRDNVFQCETVSSPFVLGILKPRIYLPYAMDDKNLSHVVAHEKAHIRRKDHWWKPLGFLLLTVYWFNPLMWVAYILLCRDIELACDEKVIAELGNEQRADYTQALVACAVNRRMIAACPLAFGEVGVKDRVKSIMNYRKPTFWIIGVSVLVCVVVAVCFLTNPEKYGEPDLSLLNYKNAVNLVIDQDEVMAIYCPTSDESGSQIQIGAADGNELAKYLNQWSWKECKAPKDTLSSPGSVEFVIDDEYRITVYQKKSGALRQYAVVKLQEDVRYYSIDRNDYADAVALVHSPAKSVDGEIAGKTYVYENEGILGSFAITLYEDGSFTYFEGLASSYIGNGSWTQEGDNITMTDDGEGGYGLVNHFKFIGENLVFVEHNSSNFVYVKVKDGERFYRTGEAFKSNGVIINSDISLSSLYAKVLEIHDGYFIVEPVEGSWELNSASQIEVPMKNMESSPEPEIGDMLLIEYDGQLAETYPARITNPLNISVLVEVQTSEIITAFEFNFVGNTSGGQKMELTEEKPYWCITVVNEGTNGINIDILGTIYMVDAGSTGHIYPDKAWEPGTYSIDFGTAGGIGMEGYAICNISSVPFLAEEPFARKIYSAERRADHPLVVYISSEWAVDKKTENVELPFNHLSIKEDGSGVIDGVDVTWEICDKYTSEQSLHIELWDDNEYVVSVVYWRDSQLLQIVDQNENLLECYYHRIAYATG